MADIIDLRAREAQDNKRRQARIARRAQAVAASLACGACPRRCMHCGMPLDEPVYPPPQVPYNFCQACLEEYLAFVRGEKGRAKPEAYWHTKEWADTWRTWLANMKANEEFRRSAAFHKLMREP